LEHSGIRYFAILDFRTINIWENPNQIKETKQTNEWKMMFYCVFSPLRFVIDFLIHDCDTTG
jgi:hypothetical protein